MGLQVQQDWDGWFRAGALAWPDEVVHHCIVSGSWRPELSEGVPLAHLECNLGPRLVTSHDVTLPLLANDGCE